MTNAARYFWRFFCLTVGISLTAACFTSPSLALSESEQTAAAAAHAFDLGEYRESARLYEELVGAGIVNGHLYYNLGNSYFREGKVGQAVAALLASRTYLPRNPDVQANLKHVLSQASDKLEPSLPAGVVRNLTFWVGKATARELLGVASGGIYLAGLFWVIFLLFQKNGFKLVSFGLGTLSLLFFAAGVSVELQGERWGAVIVESAPVSSQPSANASAVFVLREGAPFVVSAESPGWYKIQVSDGKIGWIGADSVRAF